MVAGVEWRCGWNGWLATAAAHRAAAQGRSACLGQLPRGPAADLDDYFARLARLHRSLNGKRIQPCGPGTIRTRRAELVAMARMAVRLGVPIERLTSSAALFHPDVVELVIDAYWQKNGDEPKTGTIDLGKKILRMARETVARPSRT